MAQRKKEVDRLLNLPNGCYTGKISVHPKNWKRIGASLNVDWYIYYRFHDPALKHIKEYKYGYLVLFRGMNDERDLAERRLLVQDLIDVEKKNLIKGWHPIQRVFKRPPDYNKDINPDTPFIAALTYGLSKVKAVKGTLTDMKSVVKGVEQSALKLNLHDLPISEISRKHFKMIFDQCFKDNVRFSACRHNKYKAYLSKIYKQLRQYEAVEINPLKDIDNEQYVKKQKVILTPAERILIDKQLHKKHYDYWRVVNIFFASGSRETELMKVKGKDVDLVNRRVRYTVLKGKHREVWRPIKDVVYDLWVEIMKDCKPEDFVFSVGLIPGKKEIRPDQLARRWNLHVRKGMRDDKKGINITATFYSLKHLNTTEVVDYLDDRDAARLNEHTTTAMVRTIYDVGREERQNRRIRGVPNKFAPDAGQTEVA